mmetsp:Transcript_15075/g.21150  ORF Transcript_15075/g.21150 Transcript_15075/m.21150 type:complete len:178 (-) Transcript_15075:1542-2075(-)
MLNQLPAILLTTSRSPNTDIIKISKNIENILPNCKRLPRGSIKLSSIVKYCKINKFGILALIFNNNKDKKILQLRFLELGIHLNLRLKTLICPHAKKINKNQISSTHIYCTRSNNLFPSRIFFLMNHLFQSSKHTELFKFKIILINGNKIYIRFYSKKWVKNKHNIEIYEVTLLLMR